MNVSKQVSFYTIMYLDIVYSVDVDMHIGTYVLLVFKFRAYLYFN